LGGLLDRRLIFVTGKASDEERAELLELLPAPERGRR
jgi:hypothetical protein